MKYEISNSDKEAAIQYLTLIFAPSKQRVKKGLIEKHPSNYCLHIVINAIS